MIDAAQRICDVNQWWQEMKREMEVHFLFGGPVTQPIVLYNMGFENENNNILCCLSLCPTTNFVT